MASTKHVGLSDNSMKASDRKNKTPSEYYNLYFKQGYQTFFGLLTSPKAALIIAARGRLVE
jgi:heat shock transcription factor, other eukaryote